VSTRRTIKGDANAQVPQDRADWVDRLGRERRPGPSRNSASMPGHGAATVAVHAGSHVDAPTGAVGTPIYQNTTFALDAEQYRAIDQGYARDRFIYTRYGNPSQWAVQDKLAALEGAESALVFSSGMAAIAASVLALLERGGHVIASSELYGGTYALFHHELPALGISVSYVDPRDAGAVAAAVRPETMLIFVEAMTNPLLKVVDIAALAAIADQQGARLIVDATFVSPIACRPLALGADLVVHSGSKYLNGHSDLICGAVAGSRKLIDRVWPRLLAFGGCLDPHACFLLERGMKTLTLRMRAHWDGAQRLAEFLARHSKVAAIRYPGLTSHPDHRLAARQFDGFGGLVSFAVAGGDQAALALLDHLTLTCQATSLGGVESLASLPFNTSHAGYTTRQRAALGIAPGFVRLSVGIEDPTDLIRDFTRAFEAI
jgi:cystathionine beta-lyase/cystathionine gamma-synthase